MSEGVSVGDWEGGLWGDLWGWDCCGGLGM